MTHKIYWVTPEEYTEIKECMERNVVWPSGINTEIGFKQLFIPDLLTGEPMLVKVVETSLLKELL